MDCACISGPQQLCSSTQHDSSWQAQALLHPWGAHLLQHIRHSSGQGKLSLSSMQLQMQLPILHTECARLATLESPPIPGDMYEVKWSVQLCYEKMTDTSLPCRCCALTLCRTKIRSWHLAYTRVTPRVVELVGSCPDILLLDLRGSGVKAAQLAPLRARYALSAVQGAVLSRTAAMVLAAVTLEQFVCADAVQHGPVAAAVRVEVAAACRQSAVGSSHSSLRWVNQGVAALLQAAADAAGAPFPLQQHLGS